MKTKEELNALKAEIDMLKIKLAELNEDELNEVSGGVIPRPTQYWKSRKSNNNGNEVTDDPANVE